MTSVECTQPMDPDFCAVLTPICKNGRHWSVHISLPTTGTSQQASCIWPNSDVLAAPLKRPHCRKTQILKRPENTMQIGGKTLEIPPSRPTNKTFPSAPLFGWILLFSGVVVREMALILLSAHQFPERKAPYLFASLPRQKPSWIATPSACYRHPSPQTARSGYTLTRTYSENISLTPTLRNTGWIFHPLHLWRKPWFSQGIMCQNHFMCEQNRHFNHFL